MKKSVLFALAICVSLLVFESCESAKEESTEGVKTEVLAENKESVQMKVDGMVCESAASSSGISGSSSSWAAWDWISFLLARIFSFRSKKVALDPSLSCCV